MASGLLTTLLSLCAAVGFWFWVQYRKAMKRAHRAILASQRRVLDAAQTEHDETGVRLHSVETEIDELGLSGLGAAVDDAFNGEPLPSDDADGEG